MNPWTLASAEWRSQRGAFWGVALLLATALAFALSVGWVERGLREAGARSAQRFDLLVGVAGSPTQLVLSSVYLQPQALPLLPPPVWDELARDPGVAQLIPLAGGDAVGPWPVVGTSAAIFTGPRGFALAEGQAFRAPGEAVVGAEVTLALGAEVKLAHGAPQTGGDDTADPAETHAAPLRVVGRLQATGGPWDRAVLLPIEQLWAAHAMGHDVSHGAARPDTSAPHLAQQVPVLAVQPRSVADAYRLRQRWRSGGLMAVFPAEVLAELADTLGDARRLVEALSAGTQALVFGAGLLTVAVLLATRRQAYAALRALGAPRRYLFALGWLLGMGVALRACALALPLAWAMSQLAQQAVHRATGLSLALRPVWADLQLPAGLLLACALGASLLAWRACTRSVIDDLRA